MAEELADKKTPVTIQEMAEALYQAWFKYFGSPPMRNSVLVLLAQWALETGRGKSMHNYNVGNVKAKLDGQYDYQYFACNEILRTSEAKRLQENNPTTVRITRDNGDGTSIVWFYPKHVGCCFRAFKTLDEGVLDHLTLLVNHKRFKVAWPAVTTGSPEQFAKLLRKAGYYTADENQYARTLKSLFNEFSGTIKLPVSPSVFTAAEEREIRNTVRMSLQKLSTELLNAEREEVKK